MVKKNLVNKNVIRALSLGLSIAMASQPLTAMAAEVNPIDDPATKDVHEYEDKQVADEAQGAASNAWDAVEKADGSIEKVVSDVNEKFGTATGEDVSNVVQAAGALAPQEQAPEVKEEAAEDNEETAVADDVVREAVPVAVKNDECDRAEEDITKSNDQLEIAEAQDIAKTNNANQAYDKAQEIVEEVNTANETISNAADKAEKLASTATNSTDAVVASKAVADLGKVVNEAEKAYNDAAENVEALEKAYDTAKENLKTANENYNNSLGEAKKEQVKAAKELEAAETKLANLETALTTAQNNFKDANEKALNLVSAWETVAAKKTWTSTDAFFEAVFKNYADENLLGEGVYAEKVEIIRGIGNQYYNYIKVTTADGTVKNFNYKQAVSGKIGDIKIYPVSDDEVAVDKYVTEYFKNHKEITYNASDADQRESLRAFAYKEGEETKYILKLELEQMKAAGTVVELDGYYWITNEEGDPVTVVSEVEAKRANVGTDNKVTAVDIDENTKTDSWRVTKVNENEVLEKVTKADVYRTDYEKKSLESGYTYATEEAAQAALNAAIAELANTTDLSQKIDPKTFYYMIAYYTPAWTTSWTSSDNNMARVDCSNGKENAKNKYKDLIVSLLNQKGYALTANGTSLDADFAKDWILDIPIANEDYRVYGSFTYTKNGVGQQSVTGTDSETYEGANSFDAVQAIKDKLATDGYSAFDKLEYEKKHTWGWPIEFTLGYDRVNLTGGSETYVNYSSEVKTKEKFKYAVEYLQKLGDAEKNNEEVSYQQYEHAIKLLNEIIADGSQNGDKNFITNDEDFRKLINDTKTVRDYYVTVLSELATAKQDVTDAKAAVATLGTKITALEAREDQLDVKAVKAELIKLVKEYNKMEANEDFEKLSVEELKQILDNTVADAKEKLAGLQQNVKNLQGQLTSANNSLERFRYTPDDDDKATEPGTGAITPDTPVVVPLTMDNATGVAGVRTGRRAAGNGAANAVATNEATTTTTFANQGPALAASVDDTQKLQDFQKGNVALAPAVEAQETIAWWWALIIVVLGGSGYALYKKFHSKKDDNK